MPKENADAGGAAANGQATSTLTLTEVAKRTGISMPTLQKYKKRFADRIPSVGKGRAQRYPEEALQAFTSLRDENMTRRGRPRKDAAAAASSNGAVKEKKGKAAKAAKAPKPSRARRGAAKGRRAAAGQGDGEGLLTLTQVAQKTGISYPTLMRYVKTHPDRLAHVGSGRRRRFKPESVEAFQQLRNESRSAAGGGRPKKAAKPARRGRRAAAAAAAAAAPAASGSRRGPGRPAASGGDSAGLQAMLRKLEQRLARVEEQLKKPLKIEVRR